MKSIPSTVNSRLYVKLGGTAPQMINSANNLQMKKTNKEIRKTKILTAKDKITSDNHKGK